MFILISSGLNVIVKKIFEIEVLHKKRIFLLFVSKMIRFMNAIID